MAAKLKEVRIMRIAVVGPGAIGFYCGAMHQRAGNEVYSFSVENRGGGSCTGSAEDICQPYIRRTNYVSFG